MEADTLVLDFEIPVLTEQQERELHAEIRAVGKHVVTLQTEQRPSVMKAGIQAELHPLPSECTESRHFGDLGFMVFAKSDDYMVEMVALKVAVETSPTPGKLLYQDADSPVGFTPTEVADDGEWFVEGNVKRGGCSNWTFNDRHIMLHFCDVDSLVNVGYLLARMHEFATELMEAPDGS